MSILDIITDPLTGSDDIESEGKKNKAQLLALAQSQMGLLPWQAQGADAGFSAETGQLNYELSPELQDIYDSKIDDYGTQQANLAQYAGDPDAAADAYYDRYKGIVGEDQEQERLALENRLLSQGMLGSTGGGMRTKALHGAQMKSDMEARMAADTQVQSIIDMYRGRGDSSLQGAFGVADRPFKYSNEGMTQGQLAGNQLAAANALAAQGHQSALQAQMAASGSTSAFWSGLLGLGAKYAGYGDNGLTWNAPSAAEEARAAYYKSITPS
jgi:hypothetical protein